MSFSRQTKANLVSLSEAVKHDCCRRSELYGILWAAGIFSRSRIKLVTSSEELANLTVKWLRDQHFIEGNLYITDKKSGDADERRSCKITVVQKKDLEKLFRAFRYSDSENESEIKKEIFRCQNCQTAFLRGVFLATGTVTDPDKGYHLEMDFLEKSTSDKLSELLVALGLEAKATVRKTEQVIYYKDSESIENFLALIGANNAAFTIMNKKIERELRSDINRIATGEVANIDKITKAAGAQIAAIRELKARGELERMPDELRITAYLRLENSDASLIKLAELHNPPITKSGVNHRLKKILEWKSST